LVDGRQLQTVVSVFICGLWFMVSCLGILFKVWLVNNVNQHFYVQCWLLRVCRKSFRISNFVLRFSNFFFTADYQCWP